MILASSSSTKGMFGLTYLSLYNVINICETVWESLWKQLMTCP